MACALFVVIFCGAFAKIRLGGIPHVHDEIVYQYQAKIFLLGRVTVPSPCDPNAFNFIHLINNGRMYGQYPPGFPLLLVPGLILGVPWLVSPILAGLSIFLFYRFGEELYGHRVGLWSAALGALSIWNLIMSSTMMAHTACMFFATAFFLYGARWLREPSIINAALSGLGWGMGFLIRPYSMVALSLPFLIFLGVRSLKNYKIFYKTALIFCSIVLASGLLLMLYNYFTNGNPFLMGYIVRYGANHEVGFGRTGYTITPHTPLLGAMNTWANIRSLNRDLFGWPISSLFGFLALGFSWKIDRAKRKMEMLLISGVFTLLFAYFLYWAGWVFIGARFLFESLPILMVLSARGVLEIPALAKRLCPNWRHTLIKRSLLIIFIGFTAYAFCVRLPEWIRPKNDIWFDRAYTSEFMGVTSRIDTTMRSLSLSNSVVILKLLYHPNKTYPETWYGSGFLYNDPLLRGDVIYALDRGERNADLIRCFPGRRFYLYFGTLFKGMLFTMELKNGGMRLEPIFPPQVMRKGAANLISNPREFFFPYSEEFKEFLDLLVTSRGTFVLDVQSLFSEANRLKNKKEYRNAAFYYEAALQIENHPLIRNQLYSALVGCYFKIGRNIDAKKILNTQSLKSADFSRQVFKEKGF